jgi:hypothetical protein
MILYVGVLISSNDLISLDQLGNSEGKGHVGPVACFFDFLVADDVIALIGIFADLGFHDGEGRGLLLDLQTQFHLGKIGVTQPHVIGLVLHGLKVVDGVDERLGDVADVNVVPLEMSLEQNYKTVRHGAIGEVVDQKIESHPGADAEGGGQPQGDGVAGIEQGFLNVRLEHAVERDGVEWRLLGAEDSLLSDTIATVGGGEDQYLLFAAHVDQHLDGIVVDGTGFDGLLLAKRSADQAGEGNQHIRPGHMGLEQIRMTDIPADEGQFFVMTAIEQGTLSIHKTVDDCHPVPFPEQRRNHDRSNISRAPGYKNVHSYVSPLENEAPCYPKKPSVVNKKQRK